jgi:hypothetical protein
MATDLGRAKAIPTNKYDTFVAAQLALAEKRIRLLDLTAGLLGFLALALVYIVAMVLCDSKFMLAPQTRQLALYAFLAGSAAYLFFAVVRPMRLRVNPHYAARQVEQQVPNAKNSIVNWVDLHSQPLPPAIRGALGQRAAKDCSHVNLDQAISGRRAVWMGGIAGLCAVAFGICFFVVGPAPFLSLLQRAFNPFGLVGVSTRTQLTLLKPEGGHTTLTLGRGVNFVVSVHGKVPSPKASDAVKLQYRYEEGDPWLERLLIQESNRDWTTSLSALEVKNGFWYRITGGDAATEEYRVSVRAAPAITDFLATYHFRPYVARADEARRQRELKELRGTEVRMRIHTNRALREGWLEFKDKKGGVKNERGVLDPAEPTTLLLTFLLEEDGKYRLHFTSTDGEGYTDAVFYPVTAILDNPPSVEVTKPGKDIRLPADGLLQLEGKVSDDIGVKSLELHMQVVGGERLRSQRYRSDEELRLQEEGYPRELEYKDFVELARVKDQRGQTVALRAGTELEYWLEASDACDFPQANLAQSKHYRVLLTEPQNKEKKGEEAKKQAEKEKKQHEQKQDQKLQQEQKQRQEQRQDQDARNKEEENKSKEAGKGADDEQAGQKDGGQQDQPEKNDNNGQAGANNDGKGGEGKQLSKDDQQTEDKIQKALDKQDEGKGENKPDKSASGEGKGGQADKPEQGNKAGEKSEGKEAGQQDGKQAGEGKDKGQPQAGGDPSQGDGKGDNQPSPKPGDKGEKGQPQGGESKNQSGTSQASEGKPDGKQQASKDAGQGKPKPMGQGAEAANGDSKPTEGKNQQTQREGKGDAKDSGEQKRSEGKGQGDGKDDRKAEAKRGDPTSKGEQSPSESTSSAGKRNENAPTAKSETKPDSRAQARKATAKDIDELARGLDSKDPQEREKAKRQLEQIEKAARDPQARAKAEEALEKTGQPDGATESGSAKPNNGSVKPSGGNSKDGKGKGSKGSGADSDGGEASATKDGKGGKGKNGSGSSGASPGAKGSQGASQTGGGGQERGGDGDGDGAGRDNAAPMTSKPSTPNDPRATQMQLEDFKKRVNPDILKEAGVSEEAWKKYLEAKSKQLAPREPKRPEMPVDPRQASKLPSMGGNTIQSATGPNDTHGPDRGQAPPGYRDPVREFHLQMATKKK